jgi:hypothetical protein
MILAAKAPLLVLSASNDVTGSLMNWQSSTATSRAERVDRFKQRNLTNHAERLDQVENNFLRAVADEHNLRAPFGQHEQKVCGISFVKDDLILRPAKRTAISAICWSSDSRAPRKSGT